MALYTSERVVQSLRYTVVFRAVSQIATACSYVFLVRAMEPHAFGVYNLLQALLPIISTAASLGIEQTLRRYQPEYLKSGQFEHAAWLRRLAARARLVANISIIAIIFLVWNWVAPIFKLGEYRADFSVFGILVLIHFQARIIQFSLASHMLHGYSVGAIAAMSLARLVGYALLAAQGSATVREVVVCDIIAYVCAYTVMYVGYWKHCRLPAGKSPQAPGPEEKRRLGRYALYSNFNDAGSIFSFSQIDNFFVAAFISPAAVAIYAFYTRLREMCGQLIPVRMFENIVQPMIFSVSKDRSGELIPKYFTFLANTSFAVYFPMVAYAIGFHRELVDTVFDGKYIEHSWLLPMILSLGFLNVLSMPITLVAQFQERASLILTSQAFALYLVAAMALLVPWLGVYGAALAAGSFHFVRNAYVWWRVRDMARWRGSFRTIRAHLIVWSLVIAVSQVFKAGVAVPVIVQLLVGLLLCAVGFLVLLRTAAISESDREILSQALRGRGAVWLRRLGIVRQ